MRHISSFRRLRKKKQPYLSLLQAGRADCKSLLNVGLHDVVLGLRMSEKENLHCLPGIIAPAKG